MESLLANSNHSKESLNKPCDHDLFVFLMKKMTNFRDSAPFFGLTPPEIDNIRHDNVATENFYMLFTWKDKNGSKATYLAIVNIFLEMKNRDLAEHVLQYVKPPDGPNCNVDDSFDHCDVESTTSTQSCETRITYKNWDDMTEDDKKRTQIALYRKNGRIRQKYDALRTNILESLKKNEVNFNDLKRFVYSSHTLPGEIANNLPAMLVDVTNIAVIFTTLFTRNLSWLNIKLLTAVVNEFGNFNDKRKLTTYKMVDLIPYLHRSIFEIPSVSSCHTEPGHIPLFLFLPGNPIGGQNLEFIRTYVSQLLHITDTCVSLSFFDQQTDRLRIEMGIVKKTDDQLQIPKVEVKSNLQRLYQLEKKHSLTAENEATNESSDMKDSELRTKLNMKTQQLEENLKLREDQAEEMARLKEEKCNLVQQLQETGRIVEGYMYVQQTKETEQNLQALHKDLMLVMEVTSSCQQLTMISQELYIKELKESEDTVCNLIERMVLENKEEKKASLSSSPELEDNVKEILSLIQNLSDKEEKEADLELKVATLTEMLEKMRTEMESLQLKLESAMKLMRLQMHENSLKFYQV